ncbi:hypothetical protein C2392_12945 [Salmonella enterica]|nr:hypothetical protein [Salmonella enterica]
MSLLGQLNFTTRPVARRCDNALATADVFLFKALAISLLVESGLARTYSNTVISAIIFPSNLSFFHYPRRCYPGSYHVSVLSLKDGCDAEKTVLRNFHARKVEQKFINNQQMAATLK